jgi:DNA-binding response OmpR family regulator
MTGDVLLLEDDPQMGRLLASALGREGYEVMHCTSATQACALLQHRPFDLALVDIMLGAENGLDFVRYAREKRPEIGIVIISGKSAIVDRVVGIEMGADDYVTKPLDVRELLARARRLKNRLRGKSQDEGDTLYQFAGFTLDRKRRTLLCGLGNPVGLTSKEFDLLVCLVDSGNRVISRDLIASRVHGRNWSALDRSVDVMVSNLRCKLRACNPSEVLIKSVRGTGYCFGGLVEQVARCASTCP